MSTKKTIQINPDLFNTQSTRKNREKKPKPIIKSQLINPNSLKKQLLNRIKEHKNNENVERDKNLEREKKEVSSQKENIGNFTDEFMDSIEYLNSLTKKRKEDERLEREKREKQNQYNRTLKNYSAGTNYSIHQDIQLDLPEELQIKQPTPTNVRISTEIIDQPIKLKYDKNMNVPYGCLKNGTKPTYREYHNQNTRKNFNFPVLDNYSSHSVSKPTLTEREKRLENLKEKIKMQQDAIETEKKMSTQNFINTNTTTSVIESNTVLPIFKKEEPSTIQLNIYDKNPDVGGSNDLKNIIDENKYQKKK